MFIVPDIVLTEKKNLIQRDVGNANSMYQNVIETLLISLTSSVFITQYWCFWVEPVEYWID